MYVISKYCCPAIRTSDTGIEKIYGGGMAGISYSHNYRERICTSKWHFTVRMFCIINGDQDLFLPVIFHWRIQASG